MVRLSAALSSTLNLVQDTLCATWMESERIKEEGKNTKRIYDNCKVCINLKKNWNTFNFENGEWTIDLFSTLLNKYSHIITNIYSLTITLR